MSVLGSLLGIDAEDERNLKKILRSMRTDLPALIKRVERVETNVMAISFFLRETDPVKWNRCLAEARQKVAEETRKLEVTRMKRT